MSVPGGAEFVLVDPARGIRERAFDHEKLAAALSTAASGRYTALTLPFSDIDLTADGRSVEFVAAKRRWSCDRQGTLCTSKGDAPAPRAGFGPGGPGGPARDSVASPDGTKAAFVRDFNLWVRDVASSKETQLTTDGIKDFAYATNDAGWTQERRSRRRLVARLEADRDLPSRLARRRRDVSRQHRRRSPDADDAEIPAAGRRQDFHDRARGDRRRPEEGRQDRPAGRSASLDAVRSHRLRRHVVRRPVER